jgi:hypothetical protein
MGCALHALAGVNAPEKCEGSPPKRNTPVAPRGPRPTAVKLPPSTAGLKQLGSTLAEGDCEGVCDGEKDVEGVSLGEGATRGVEAADSDGGAPGVSDGLGLPLADGVPVCEGDRDGALYVHASATSPVWPAYPCTSTYTRVAVALSTTRDAPGEQKPSATSSFDVAAEQP